MAKIGFIGTGHIAAPMARYLARRGHQVFVSERNAETAAELAAEFANITVLGNQGVIDAADIVFLCLRPHLALDVLDELSFRADQRIVSVMAGIPLARLGDTCAPAREICLTIPLGFLEQGGCPLAVTPDGETLSALFGADNPIIPVATEAALNQHFAICAMVPGVLSLMDTASDWLAASTGDRDNAERYVTELMGGFLATMQPGAGALHRETFALATDGTLSLQMVEALKNGGSHELLRDALAAIGKRLG